jgi:hypothetical protein
VRVGGAEATRHGDSPFGGVGRGDLRIDNGLSDLRPIQHEGGQRCSAPLLFRQDLPNSYWSPVASFGEFI